ncbi:hypothetical protein GCM10010383_54170 [Streptomyces lomondensis]|uniref:Uncharacterized protein n=1 Tax=Streptomyces lomondensis TaxID=68229 RepID=A0ABQ2XH00_9ACTN|nr:hypothetical protein GCM10010383_54170 [Streptomyces lomondensis]
MTTTVFRREREINDHGLQPFAVVGVGGRDTDEEGQSVRVPQDAPELQWYRVMATLVARL